MSRASTVEQGWRACVLVVLLCGCLTTVPRPTWGQVAAQTATGDFDHDGFADLAVGVFGDTVAGAVAAGTVRVWYGTATGLTTTRQQVWHQDSAGVGDSAEPQDVFGSSLAVGDFNGDGLADLAIGVPGERVGTVPNAGAVHILYGTATGLSATGNQLWHQQSALVAETAELDDLFGASLAVGDFNGDGVADLAIGVPGESVGSVRDAGAVHILYGTATGLRATGSQLWHQNSPGMPEATESGDFFGWALSSGDFNGDGFADLAISAVGESLGTVRAAGLVHLVYGTASGLSATGTQRLHQNSAGMLESIETADFFGWTLSSGDFNGDGFADLAIGVPIEGLGASVAGGVVHIVYGGASGLTTTGNQLFHQDSSGMPERVEGQDGFGASLTSGDFNGDQMSDLAVGVFAEGLGAVGQAGAVHILYGTPSGVTVTGTQLFSQDTAGVRDVAEADDLFGWALASGDFNGDGFADLAIEVFGEDVATLTGSPGAVQALYGASTGLSVAGDSFFPFAVP